MDVDIFLSPHRNQLLGHAWLSKDDLCRTFAPGISQSSGWDSETGLGGRGR